MSWQFIFAEPFPDCSSRALSSNEQVAQPARRKVPPTQKRHNTIRTCMRMACNVVCTASVSMPSPRFRFCAAPRPPPLPPAAPCLCGSNCTPNKNPPANVRRTCNASVVFSGRGGGEGLSFNYTPRTTQYDMICYAML